jgi:ankyrin repeat protein
MSFQHKIEKYEWKHMNSDDIKKTKIYLSKLNAYKLKQENTINNSNKINQQGGTLSQALHEVSAALANNIAQSTTPVTPGQPNTIKTYLYRDHHGNTPLHDAIRTRDINVVQHFIANLDNSYLNAETNTNNPDYPINVAVNLNFGPAVGSLLQAGANAWPRQNSPLFSVYFRMVGHSDNDERDMLTMLNALLGAAQNQRITIQQYVNDENRNGECPLHWMAGNRMPGVARTLMGAGADIYARDDNNNTPLHHAVKHGDKMFGVVELLLNAVIHNQTQAAQAQAQAQPPTLNEYIFATNNDGMTAFDVAVGPYVPVYDAYLELCHIARANGIDVNYNEISTSRQTQINNEIRRQAQFQPQWNFSEAMNMLQRPGGWRSIQQQNQ